MKHLLKKGTEKITSLMLRCKGETTVKNYCKPQFSKSALRKMKDIIGSKTLEEAERVLLEAKKILESTGKLVDEQKETIKSSLDKALREHRNKIKEEVIPQITANFLLNDLYICYEKYRYKNASLRRKLHYIMDTYEMIQQADVTRLTTGDLNKILLNKAGFDVQKEIILYGEEYDKKEKIRELSKAYDGIAYSSLTISEVLELAESTGLPFKRYGGDTVFSLKEGSVCVGNTKYDLSFADLVSEDWELMKEVNDNAV